MNRDPQKIKPALAVYAILWLLEDVGAVPAALRRRLTVPPMQLMNALAFLSPAERQELKDCILTTAANGHLPGPLKAPELCDFVDWFATAKLATAA